MDRFYSINKIETLYGVVKKDKEGKILDIRAFLEFVDANFDMESQYRREICSIGHKHGLFYGLERDCAEVGMVGGDATYWNIITIALPK